MYFKINGWRWFSKSLTEAISEKSWWFLAYISNLGLDENWNYTDYNAGMQKWVYG